MADILKGGQGSRYGGQANIGYIPPMQDRSAELREQSLKALPELEALLNEKGALFSLDRKYAIIRDGGTVRLRERMKGFPVEGWEDVSSQGTMSKFSLLALFQCMEESKEDYPKEWN